MARGRRHRPASGSDARLKMNARVASESLPIISTAPRENGSNEINHALAFRSHKRLPSPAAPIGPTPPSHAPVGSLARSGSPSVRSGSTIKASKRVLLSPVLSREGTWCFRETYPHLSSLKHATSGLRLAQHLHLRPCGITREVRFSFGELIHTDGHRRDTLLILKIARERSGQELVR